MKTTMSREHVDSGARLEGRMSARIVIAANSPESQMTTTPIENTTFSFGWAKRPMVEQRHRGRANGSVVISLIRPMIARTLRSFLNASQHAYNLITFS
jgi:hypothetical protein